MDTQNIKTASDLKFAIEQAGTSPHFFTRSTMRFFGDTMRNYGVRKTTINTYTEGNVPVFELYRRHPVKHNNQDSAFFRIDNLERAYKKKDWQDASPNL